MSDPVTIISDLEDLTGRLDKASRDLYLKQEEFEKVAENYDDAFNDLLIALLDEYETSEKRLPGEDVRNALVIKKLRDTEPSLFGQHRRLKAELDRMERRAKRIEKEVNAKQSILSYLKTEAMATT